MKIAIVLSFLLPLLSYASPSVESAVKGYAAKVFADYSESARTAEELRKAIQEFVANPSDRNLAAAKGAWNVARAAYSPTEVYRFYEGPIDNESGPEGLINAWPLDEAYIDYVVGNQRAGIINDLSRYPEISKELLVSLNEKEGEKNISTGFHAIEFLLWGQDFNPAGPGSRPASDFVVGVGKNADRRSAYLLAAAELLVEHLSSVRDQWAPEAGTYGEGFAMSGKEGLRRAMLGAYRLSAEELSHERMFVAYDTQLQEDEHSCFSDTTHLDFQFNFLGIQNVLLASGGPYELMQAVNAARAEELKAATLRGASAVNAIPGPFDRAIYSEEGRARILEAVTALEDLAVLIKASGNDLGLSIE